MTRNKKLHTTIMTEATMNSTPQLPLEKLVNDANPMENVSVLFPYNDKKLSPKKKNKEALQKQLEFTGNVGVPLACVITSFIDEHGMCLIKDIIDGLMSVGMEMIIIAHDDKKTHECIDEVVKKYPGRIKSLNETPENIAKALSAADIYLAPGKSRPHYIGQILALKFGVVPILHHSENLDGLLEDYDPRTEAGHGFLFNFHNHWSFFAAVVRALETYKLSYDWNTIVRNGMGVEL